MADPTPAEELRAAAAKVRKYVEAAADPTVALLGGSAINAEPNPAAMHPALGLVLAAWMESLDGVDFNEHGPGPDELIYALAVARAINGGPR